MGNDLSVSNSILLFQNRIITPVSLREKVLQLAHKSHQSVLKTKALLREKVWWLGINVEVEELIKHCHTCEVTTASKSNAQPLAPTSLPEDTRDILAIDLQRALPSGDSLLVMIGSRSRYPFVYLIRNASAGKIIKSMNSTFSLFGYPKVLLSDNGPHFKSFEFRNYCEQYGIKQQLISPNYPAANGEVENMNRTLKKAIQRTCIEGKDWKEEIEKFLLAYCSTPYSSTGIAPANLLLKHRIRTDIPQIQPTSKSLLDIKGEQQDALSKCKVKDYTYKKRHAKFTDFQIVDLVLLTK